MSFDKARAVAIPLVLTIAVVVLGRNIQAHDPISDWLVWRYLTYAGLALVWGASCLSMGFAIGRVARVVTLPLRECLMQSFMLGVLAFALVTVLVGLVGGLGKVSFVGLPLVFLAAGGRGLLRYLRRAWRRVQRLAPRAPSALGLLGALYGLACLAALYLAILTPSNVAYDARWYHLPIAEHFATGGYVERFDEGWYSGTIPHLASWLYTWAFCVPAGGLFAQTELAVHLEYVVFAATVFAVPVLIHQLIGRPRVRSAWMALFLFPGILVYDSNLNGAADHVLAFWAIPIFVAFRRFWRQPRRRDAFVLGSALAGAALTKYQAMYLLAFPFAALGLRAVWQLVRARLQLHASLAPIGVFSVTFLAATSSHWLLNLIWHGSPLYPMFGGHPFAEGVPRSIPLDPFFFEGTLVERMWLTLKGVASFGFVAHDWQSFHGARAVYGSLFLPALLLLPAVKTWRRLLPLAAAGLFGVTLWLWTYHQDRYLQALTPWLAALVFSVLVAVWRRVALSRPWIAVLVALQVWSCADLYFLPTHAMTPAAPIHRTMDLFSSGYRKAFAERDETFSRVDGLAGQLPKGSKVLVHEMHLHLGLGYPAVRDGWARQAGINYALLGNPYEIQKLLRSMKVTHALWSRTPMGLERFGDDLAFARFVQVSLRPTQLSGDLWWAALPQQEMPIGPANPVALVSCTVQRFTTQDFALRWDEIMGEQCASPAAVDLLAAMGDADVAVVDPRRYGGVPPEIGARFTMLFTRDGFWVLGRN